MKMFKKYAWIVALLAALSMLFFACGSPGGDDDGDGDGDGDGDREWLDDLFVLSDYLEDLGHSVGDTFKFPATAQEKTDFFGDAFQEACQTTNTSCYVKVIDADGEGTLGLEIFTGEGQNWGAGIDLKYGFFQFYKEDVITISGEGDEFWKFGTGDTYNSAVNDWYTDGSGEEFDEVLTLTEAEANASKTNEVPGFRLGNKGKRGAGGGDAGAAKTIKIYSLTVSGNRLTEAVFEPIASIKGVPTGGVVGEEVVLGGTIDPNYADAADTPIAWSIVDAGTTGVTAITGGKFTPTAAGTIKVLATVENGLTEDTDYTEEFAIVIIAPPMFSIKLDGVDTDVRAYYSSTADFTLLDEEDGFEYTSTGGWGNPGFVYFKVNLGEGKTVADIGDMQFAAEVSSTYKAVGLSASDIEYTSYYNAAVGNGIGVIDHSGEPNNENPWNYGDSALTLKLNEDVEFGAEMGALGPEVFIYIWVHGQDLTLKVTDIEITLRVAGVFVPVTDIILTSDTTIYLDAGTGEASLTLEGGVRPASGTNYSDIVWSIKSFTEDGEDDPVDAGDIGDYVELDGDELTAFAAGTVVVTATVENGEAEGTDFTKDFEIEVAEALPEFPEFTDAKTMGMSNPKQWSIDADDEFNTGTADFIVFATVGGGSNANGFGGMQFQLQGEGATGQNMMDSGDWTSFAHTADEIVYVVLDLSAWETYDSLGDGDAWVQFRINYGDAQLGTYQAYYVTKDLTKPTGAVDLKDEGNAGDTTGAVFGFITTDIEEAGLTFDQ